MSYGRWKEEKDFLFLSSTNGTKNVKSFNGHSCKWQSRLEKYHQYVTNIYITNYIRFASEITVWNTRIFQRARECIQFCTRCVPQTTVNTPTVHSHAVLHPIKYLVSRTNKSRPKLELNWKRNLENEIIEILAKIYAIIISRYSKLNTWCWWES